MCNHHNHSHNHVHSGNKSLQLKFAGFAFIILLIGLISNVDGWIKFVIFGVAYLIVGYDVILRSIKNIFKGEIFDENFLMTIASAGAFVIHEYPEAVMVMILFQIGEYLQDKAVEKSRKSITKLMDIRPDYANIEINGELKRVSPERIKIGDVFVVQPGEKIPLDGKVEEGDSMLDTTALTGESVPREVSIGDIVNSGCINLNGVLKIKAEKDFKDSTVSKILKLVETTSAKKAKSEHYITKFAKFYTPVVCGIAILFVVIPPMLMGGNFGMWLERALTFLVISCPCALVISVPLSFFAGIGGAAKNGILIKGAKYVETLANTDTIAFDKTGTLTEGVFEVSAVAAENGFDTQSVINMAALVESFSTHPIAIALKKAASIKLDVNLVKNIQEIPGKGVVATVKGKKILVGNKKLMSEYKIIFNSPQNAVGTTIYVSQNNVFAGIITISDRIKQNSKTAIKLLQDSKIKTVMLTGDNDNAADLVAKKLDIKTYYAQLLPQEKIEILENLITQSKSGHGVVFVGDGINDAPVLSRADIGIAMGGIGSAAAVEAADVVIMDDNLIKIPQAVKIAQKTLKIVKQNIAFSIGVKMLFLLLGAFGLISMWGAVFADTGVCLIAIANSLRAAK